MLLAKSRPIVVICIADGSHFARERLMAFTPWHLDAVSGSHPPHLLLRDQRTYLRRRPRSPFDPEAMGTAADDYAALATRPSISVRSATKSIGLVSNPVIQL